MKKFDTEVHLRREMKLLDVTMIGVGAMIGAGIFVLTGIAAGVAGPGLLVAFTLNGVVALMTAMSYAELGSCYHDAGGGYLWVKEGLPKWNGFLSGWMSWFAHAVACALYALGFGAYFDHVIREFGIQLPHWGFISPQKLLAVGIATIFAFINFRGASETGKIGNIVTMAKIVILAIFVGFGLEVFFSRGDVSSAFTPFLPNGMGGVFKAMGLTFIAFQGFEVISQCSEEVENPKKNIPRAVFLSLLIVIPIYLLVAVSSLASVRPGAMTPWAYLALQKETALVGVAESFFTGGGVLLLIGGLISTMSALNATVYSSSRVAFAMGRDRNFPAAFSRVHSRRFTPYVAIAGSFVIVAVMCLSLDIEDVASAADIMFLLLFLQVNVTLIRLRKLRPDLDRGYFVPLFPYLTVAGISALLFLAFYMFNYSPLGWFVTLVWIGFGLIVYKSYASKREVRHVRRVEALQRLERKDYTILVALSNPESTESLTRLAVAIAKKHDGEVLLLHVVEVDQGVPLKAGIQASENQVEFLEHARLYVQDAGVPVRSIVQLSHRISQGILYTAIEERVNFIVLGRPKNPSFMERIFSSVIDTVLDEAPCEVAVLHGEIRSFPLNSVLIPFGENIHTRLAIEIAPALIDYFACKAEVVFVADPRSTTANQNLRLRNFQNQMASSRLNAGVHILANKGVRQGVVELSKNTDLIVMGGRSGDFYGLLFGQSLTQEITEQAACPVLWINEYEERSSLLELLFTRYEKDAKENNYG